MTDPPYVIAYQTGRRKVMDTPDLLANDTEAPLWSVPLMYDKLEDGGAIYLCTRFDVAHQWQQALTDAGAILKTPIVWDKGNWTSGDLTGDYGNQCELILSPIRAGISSKTAGPQTSGGCRGIQPENTRRQSRWPSCHAAYITA